MKRGRDNTDKITVITIDHVSFTLCRAEYEQSKTLKNMVTDTGFDGDTVSITCESTYFAHVVEYMRNNTCSWWADARSFVGGLKALTEVVVYLDIPPLLEECIKHIVSRVVGKTPEEILTELGIDEKEISQDELDQIKKEFPWVEER